ncbi:MAG: OsmC family protein, partial [Leptolyngbya sp.]|nr:OsmC family protein [Candidatus Melainabacteria bacterium]
MTEFQVTATPATPFKQEIKSVTHTFVSDAPKEFGGGDLGPNPHELLLGALGACTSITIQMYAQRKGWVVKNISVKVSEEVIEDPNNAGKKLSSIVRDVKIEGDLTEEQIESLKVVADKCPIHKIIDGPSQIKTN